MKGYQTPNIDRIAKEGMLFTEGRVFTEPAPATPDKALEILGLLLDDLAKARSLI